MSHDLAQCVDSRRRDRPSAVTKLLPLLLFLASLLACSGSEADEDAGAGDASAPVDAAGPPRDASSDASDAGAVDAGPSCPAGSILRHARTSCTGAPLAPPAAFASAIAAAAPGDVVAMNGIDESTAPCLPVLVCRPSDAPTLLFSDSPEMPASDGVLYADSVAKGRHRLYVYHANGGASVRKFPVVVLNQGTTNAKVTIVRRGLAAPSKQYVSVGKTVLLDWLADRAPLDVAVPAGERVLLDPELDALHAGKDELVHAIYDVVTDATLKISFVSVAASADAVAQTAGLSLLARDPDHQRGTFPAADVLVVAASPDAQRTGVQRLRLGKDEVDATLEGVDVATGDPQKLLGNYGMQYRFVLGLAKTAHAGLSPRGGAWGGAARIATTSTALPSASASLGTTTDAIALGAIGPATELRLLSAGGSNLPVDLFLVTP